MINLRTMQVVIVAAMASWGIMDGIGNLIVYDTWVKIVAFVLTLEETMVNGAPHPRAIYNPVLPHIGYAFIYLSKLTGGVLCVMGAVKMWKSRLEVAEVFNAAKEKFYMGIGFFLFMLIFGFVTLKGGMFNTGDMPSDFTLMVFDFVTLFLAMCGAATIFVSIPTHAPEKA